MPSTIRKDGYPLSEKIMLRQAAGTDDDSEKIIPPRGASLAERKDNNVAPDRLHAAWLTHFENHVVGIAALPQAVD